jgi:hypothetical protein
MVLALSLPEIARLTGTRTENAVKHGLQGLLISLALCFAA